MDSKVESDGPQTSCQGDGTKCVECGKLFSHAFYFGTHIVTHVGEKPYQAVGQCGMCGLVFSDMAVHQAHMASVQSRVNTVDVEQEEFDEGIEDLQKPHVEKEPHQPLSPLPKIVQKNPSKQPVAQHDSDNSVLVSKEKAQPKPLSESKPDSKLKSEPEVKAEVKEDSTPAKQDASSKDQLATGDLPRKRIRRAPDKFEIYPEEKKRRNSKPKPVHPPGYDPEVEKYLQSLRDMGFSVAPDTPSPGREPPTKRGRGASARGRGVSSRPGQQSPRPSINNFNMPRGGKVGSPASSRGSMEINKISGKMNPHSLNRNFSPNYLSNIDGRTTTYNTSGTMNKNSNAQKGFHVGTMSSTGMPGKDKQSFFGHSSARGDNSSLGSNNRNTMVPNQKMTFKNYIDYDEDIVSLINSDLEIMPVSGKSTRGERLRQRHDRLSSDGTGEGLKKVQYFPRSEKTKGRKTPQKDKAAARKLQQQIERSKAETISFSHTVNLKESLGTVQITNVRSLTPHSSSKGKGKSNKEYLSTAEVGTIRNVAGRMEDLREEARKKVEEMLAAPAVITIDDDVIEVEECKISDSDGGQSSRRGTHNVDNGRAEDKDEIMDGADIEGWTVSISKASDSDREEADDSNNKKGGAKGTDADKLPKEDQHGTNNGNTGHDQNDCKPSKFSHKSENSDSGPDKDYQKAEVLSSDACDKVINSENDDLISETNEMRTEPSTGKKNGDCLNEDDSGADQTPNETKSNNESHEKTKLSNFEDSCHLPVASKSNGSPSEYESDMCSKTSSSIKNDSTLQAETPLSSSEVFLESQDQEPGILAPGFDEILSETETRGDDKDPCNPDQRKSDSDNNYSVKQCNENETVERSSMSIDASYEKISAHESNTDMCSPPDIGDMSKGDDSSIDHNSKQRPGRLDSQMDNANPSNDLIDSNSSSAEINERTTSPKNCFPNVTSNNVPHCLNIKSFEGESESTGLNRANESTNSSSHKHELEDNDNTSQRYNSSDYYDVTDNFSEIEKTCQEIIRGAENQEGESENREENS